MRRDVEAAERMITRLSDLLRLTLENVGEQETSLREELEFLERYLETVKAVSGDITKADTLPAAIDGARHIVFTAGCRSGFPVREPLVKATEYQGVINTLEAARRGGFAGRFLYMTSSGVMIPSFSAVCLNLWKGNTLIWRRRVEDEIRASGLDYTIIRTGILLNRAGGQRVIEVTQRPLPLSPHYRIARADVAEVFLAALEHPRATRATFEIIWGPRGRPEALGGLLDRVEPDARLASTSAP